MRDPDVTALLDTLAEGRDGDEFDPDSPFALASLERILAEPPLRRPRRRLARPRRTAGRLAIAAVPAMLAALAIAIVPSLGGGSHSGTAQAAVIAHAAAALAPADSILDLQVQQYSAVGGGPCMAGGAAPGTTPPSGQIAGLMCVGGSKPAYPAAGISADPTDDTLTDSYQEWVSPDGSQDHTLYDNGDETVLDAAAQQYQAYDAQTNTLTTLTGQETTAAPPAGAQASPLPSPSTLQDPSYYENLYQQAQAGQLGAQLLGQTTINGESVYELQFTIDRTPPANPPAGDMCGTTVCTPPGMQILLYLDSQSFTPVRTVTMTINSSDRPGMPAGTSVDGVTDFTVQALQDTPANQALLSMNTHAGATQVQETQAQWHDQLGAALQASVAANVARAGSAGSDAAAAASIRTRRARH